MIIEYDKSPNITPDQRLKSLADSVRRALEEIETLLEERNQEETTLERLGGYPKTGGLIDGDVYVTSPNAGLSNRAYGVNKVLWNGTKLMTNGETADLTEAISAQPHGIVLVWSYYTNGAGANQYWNMVFVPKWFAKNLSGSGMAMMLTSTPTAENMIAPKYVYISDKQIKGYAGNSNDGIQSSNSGAKIKSGVFALRYVIGV